MDQKAAVSDAEYMSQIGAQPLADVRERYARDGVVQVCGLLSRDEVDAVRDTFMDQVERDLSLGWDDNVPADDPLARYPRFVQPHRRTDIDAGRLARRWMLDPRILDVVASLAGPSLAAQSMFYFKPPGARGQALHQDNLSLRTHPETCLAVWIAVDDCDEENGALKVVPGSQAYDLECPQHEANMSVSFTSREVTVPAGLSVEQTKLAAGDALVFHGNLIHGSGANHSATRFRRSLIFHYVPEGSREVATLYQPLLTSAGSEVVIDESVGGGPCGAGWQLDEPD
jgi:phytanoyl-CoA hydroxylase